MATPSARDMLMQVQRYANGGTASAGSSVGLARALANGTSQEQYYQNIREYVAKNPNPLAALNAASENGVSTADINSALGTKAASDYFTIDYSTETAPSTNVATGFTSALAQRYNAPGGPGQSALDARIKEISEQYAAKTPENAQILRDLFIKEGASIADVQRAGVDPSVLLGVARPLGPPPLPELPPIPLYTPPVVTPETQTQYPQPKPYTATSVYQPLPAPPPIYGAGQPALDVAFRNSAPRTYDPVYGYTYTPAAKLLSATGAGMSWTPPSVTSRPRELLKVPLPTAANPQYSASQQFARDRAAAQLAALPGGRFSGTPAPEEPPVDPNAPVDPYAVTPTELRFYAPKVAAKGGEIKKSEGSAQEELARFANGGPVATDRKPLAATDPLYIQTDTPAPRNPDAVARPTPMSHADLLAQIDRGTAASPNAKTPDPAPTREQTESLSMLRRINDTFGRNVTAPVLGSIVDMSVGLGDIGQVATKYLANRAGIETAPVTPVASNIKSKLGLEYDPYHPAAIATQLALPALSRARAMTSAASPAVRAVAAPPGSAKELLERVGGEAAREGQIYVGSELGAQTAREIAPDNAMAEMVGAMIGGTAVNTAQNLDPRTVNNITQAQMASSMIPIAGGAVKAARAVGKASKAADDLAALTAKAPTDTPEFKNFFGESKVVNESGQPLRVYHGTDKDISQFKLSKEGALGSGIYMTPDPAFAGEYAKNTGANILPVYVSLKNPLILGQNATGYSDPMIEALKKLGLSPDKAENLVEKAYEEKGYIGKQVQSRATAQGYDGIMQYRDGKLTEVLAFNPTQIKSAIGNEGTFDPANPVITKAQGGYVTKKTKGAKP